jgi:hypothetical protein
VTHPYGVLRRKDAVVQRAKYPEREIEAQNAEKE